MVELLPPSAFTEDKFHDSSRMDDTPNSLITLHPSYAVIDKTAAVWGNLDVWQMFARKDIMPKNEKHTNSMLPRLINKMMTHHKIKHPPYYPSYKEKKPREKESNWMTATSIKKFNRFFGFRNVAQDDQILYQSNIFSRYTLDKLMNSSTTQLMALAKHFPNPMFIEYRWDMNNCSYNQYTCIDTKHPDFPRMFADYIGGIKTSIQKKVAARKVALDCYVKNGRPSSAYEKYVSRLYSVDNQDYTSIITFPRQIMRSGIKSIPSKFWPCMLWTGDIQGATLNCGMSIIGHFNPGKSINSSVVNDGWNYETTSISKSYRNVLSENRTELVAAFLMFAVIAMINSGTNYLIYTTSQLQPNHKWLLEETGFTVIDEFINYNSYNQCQVWSIGKKDILKQIVNIIE